MPALFLFGAAALFFREALFTGATLYYRDLTFLFHPSWRLIGRLIREGTFPFWNPYVMAGVPLAADVVNGVFYPPSVLLWLPSLETAYKLFVVAHYALAGGLLYLWARGVGLPRCAALFGALGYMLSGPLLSLSNVVNFLPGAAWLPLVVLLYGRALGDPTWRTIAATGAVLGLQALTDPQMVYMTLLALVVVTLSGAPPPRVQSLGRAGGVLVGAGAIAALLAAIQLVPLAELYFLSSRYGSRSYPTATAWSLPPWRLLELVVARLFGDPAAGTYRGAFMGGVGRDPWLLSPYCGLPILVAAALGFLVRWREPLVRALVLLVGLGLVLALGDFTPLYRVAYAWVPLLAAFHYPEKWMVLVAFGMAGLGATGCSVVLDADAARGRWVRRVAVFVLALAVALAALLVGLIVTAVDAANPLGPWMGAGTTPRLAASALRRVIGPIALATALLAGVGLALEASRRASKRMPLVAAALLGLLLIDLLVNQRYLVPLAPGDLHRTPSPLAEAIRADQGIFRIFVLRADGDEGPLAGPAGAEEVRRLVGALHPNTAMRFGLFEVGGLGSARLRGYDDSMRQFAAEGRLESALALWNVKYLVSRRSLSDPAFEEIARTSGDRPIHLYRHAGVLPRAFWVPTARSVPREAHARTMADAAFDPRREVLLEAGGEASAGVPTDHAVDILAYSPNAASVAVRAPSGGYLVLADTYYPGWRATVDGRPTPILRANGLMRAVRLPAGAHRVDFTFRPVTVLIGAAVSGLTLAGLGLICWIDRSPGGRRVG